ncbi:MAG: CRISPR-associated endonuclease Cas1 [candidate division WOR-3 bacterium]
MQLVINTPGTYIYKEGELIKIKTKDGIKEISADKIESVLITTAIALTTDVIHLCIEKNIDIVFLDEFGEPFGRVWHPRLSGTNLIRRVQLELSEKVEGTQIALKWMRNKIALRIDFLKELRQRRPQHSRLITHTIKDLKDAEEKLSKLVGNPDEIRNTLMGIEGNAGKEYFKTLSFLVPEKFRFEGRSSRPAKDRFNALLNYAYGILYSLVERGCILAGLDPCIGFFHTDDYNKKSLVYDLIESFRPWAEIVVFNLISERKIEERHFDSIRGGFKLNREGKTALIPAFNEYLEQSIRTTRGNMKRINLIRMECHSLANQLVKVYARQY